jgi:hypothetical protein
LAPRGSYMAGSSFSNQGTRITVPPGTQEYQRQFEGQALAAADGSLRMGIVRIACGFLALVSGFLCVAPAIDGDWLAPFYFALPTVELGSVAIRGKSICLRFLLSGVRRKHTERNWFANDDQPQSPASPGQPR